MAGRSKFWVSLKRIRAFEECKWKYYLEYYLHQNVWEPALQESDFTPAIPAWKGKYVHKGIESALLSLKEGKPISLDEVIEKTNAVMENDFELLLKKREYRFIQPHPLVSEGDLYKSQSFVAFCLANFFECNIYRELKGLAKGKILSIEGSEDQIKREFQEFDFLGVPVLVRLDLAYENEEGMTIVVDWKSGETKEEIRNLTFPVYALYAVQKFCSKPPLMCIEYNISTQSQASVVLEQEDVLQCENRLKVYISEMRSYLRNIPKNLPKEQIHFPRDGKEKGSCRNCEYRGWM